MERFPVFLVNCFSPLGHSGQPKADPQRHLPLHTREHRGPAGSRQRAGGSGRVQRLPTLLALGAP